MKKILALLLTTSLITSSCTKDKIRPIPEVAATKKIAFDVFTQRDYSAPFYDNSLAEVRLNVSKLNLRNNSVAVVWDTTYCFRQFKQYPDIAQKIYHEKTVQYLESYEVVRVSTVVRYKLDGNVSMEARGEDVPTDQNYKLTTVSF